MKSNQTIKIIAIIIILLAHISVYEQNDTISKAKNYNWCIEWLDEMKPAILADTLGKYGAKWSATERLLSENCNFEGELFPIIKYYFGDPDRVIDFSRKPWAPKVEYSMRYILFKPSGTSTTGMKWLIVNCDKDYRILEFSIFTIDE